MNKMQSPVNIRFTLLIFVSAMATVSSTNKTPSDNDDKAIHSLEATLAKKLDQIIAIMNSCFCGNPNVGPGIFCQGLMRIHFKMDLFNKVRKGIITGASSFLELP